MVGHKFDKFIYATHEPNEENCDWDFVNRKTSVFKKKLQWSRIISTKAEAFASCYAIDGMIMMGSDESLQYIWSSFGFLMNHPLESIDSDEHLTCNDLSWP